MEQQPEILSREEIIKIFKQKRFPIDGVDVRSKKELIKAYYSHVIPKPQRDRFRGNRRGKQLETSFKRRSHQRISVTQSAATETNSTLRRKPTPSNQPGSNSRFISSYNVASSSGDRLKPPPSAINFDRKVIKLGKQEKPNSTSVTANTTKCISTSSSNQTKPTAIKTSTIKLSSSSTSSSDSISSIKINSPKFKTAAEKTASSLGDANAKSQEKPSKKTVAAINSSPAKAAVRTTSTELKTASKTELPKKQTRKLKLTRPSAAQYGSSNTTSSVS